MCATPSSPILDEEEAIASDRVTQFIQEMAMHGHSEVKAMWTYQTNVTSENAARLSKASTKVSEFNKVCFII